MQDPIKHAVLARDSRQDSSVPSHEPLSCPPPSRCPYCAADTPLHWIRWGRYRRYAGDADDLSRKVAVTRYRCKHKRRTFSLLPDALLPHCSMRAPVVLSSMEALFIGHVALGALARRASMPRGTLRQLKRRYLHTVRLLRLPSREGALAPGAFLEALLGGGAGRAGPEEIPPSVVDLFRTWKECEPKHSVVGIYAR